VAGDILSSNAEAVRSDVLKVLEENSSSCRTLELELVNSRMVDSMGLNTIVSVVKRAKALGLATRVLIPNAGLHRIFRFTRMDQHMDVVLQGA
jgi:anti-anti-sigma factor